MENKHFLVVENTKIGKAVFANRSFKKGETIFEFHGEFFNHQELPRPYSEVEDHYVQIGKDLYMGPSGDIDDFFNHSCNPNSGLKISRRKVFLVAIKNIKIGEEIVWDYSTTMDQGDWEMKCGCGNKGCRGIIRDFKYLPLEVQKKYLNLGIVPKYISDNLKKK